MTRLKNVKGHPPSYGKPWDLFVCLKVHLALLKLVYLKEKKLYSKILKWQTFSTIFLFQWQKTWLQNYQKN